MKQSAIEELEVLDNKLLDCLAVLDEVDKHNLPSKIRTRYETLCERIRKFDIEIADMYESDYDDLNADNNYGMDGSPIIVVQR